MTKIKRIFFVNAPEAAPFTVDFLRSCKRLKAPCIKLSTQDCFFEVAHNQEPRLIWKNRILKPTKTDFFFIRKRSRDSVFTYLLCEYLQAQRITFLDPINARHTDEATKIGQMLKFSLANLPIPKTLIFTPRAFRVNQKYVFSKLKFPCVLKIHGRGGEKVWKMQTKAELLKKLEKIEEIFLLQEYIPNPFDLRLLMFRGRLIGAIRRYSKDGFYNNISRGGRGEATRVSVSLIKLAKQAAQVAGLDLAGVDLILTKSGPRLLEANKSPEATVRYYAKDIHAKIVKAIMR